MDKSTLSNYGWIVIVTLVLAVMLALATPFGTFVGKGASNVIKTFVQSSDSAVDEDNIDTKSEDWDIYLNNDDYNHKGVVPEGGVYTDVNGNVYTKGDSFPELQTGDEYQYGDYTYKCTARTGFRAYVKDTTQETYGPMLDTINGIPVAYLMNLFSTCTNLKYLDENFRMPSQAINCNAMFRNCKSIEYISGNFVIPKTVKSISSMFYQCTSLKTLPENFTIPKTVLAGASMFAYCTNFTGTVTIEPNPNSPMTTTNPFAYTEKPIIVRASATQIQLIKEMSPTLPATVSFVEI